MNELTQLFNKLAANFDTITLGLIGLIIFLLIIILFSGRKKGGKSKKLKRGQDFSLDKVMDQLQGTSDNVQILLSEYREKIKEQEQASVERQMHVQQLEEKIELMQQEIQGFEETSPELQDRIKTINQESTKAFKRKLSRNSYRMLLTGFLLGLIGFIAGNYYATYPGVLPYILNWFKGLIG